MINLEQEKAPEVSEPLPADAPEAPTEAPEEEPQIKTEQIETKEHPVDSAILAVKSKPQESSKTEAESIDSLCNGGAVKEEPSAVKNESAPEQESAKSSILQLTFDYDGTAELPVIPKAFLSEGKQNQLIELKLSELNLNLLHF